MALTPNPSNSIVHPSRLLGFYVGDDPDFADDGMKTVMVLHRESTMQPWQQPNVWVASWNPAQDLRAWIEARIVTMNVRLMEITGDPQMVVTAQPGVPATSDWPAMQTWFLANVRFPQSAPVPSPAPSPTPGVLWGSRHFFGGYAFEIGITPDGRPAARVQDNGWKEAKF